MFSDAVLRELLAKFAAMIITISEISATDYHHTFVQPRVIYGSLPFTRVNEAKARRIVHAVAHDEAGRAILGLTIGEREEGLFAPFSAPFAMFDYNREHGTEAVFDAVGAFVGKYPGLQLTLPPSIYYPSMNSKLTMSLLSAGARLQFSDWNYHVDLTRPYRESLTSAARNKLSGAMRGGFRLERSTPERAYEIIRKNREFKGYPLRMTMEQVLATVKPAGPVTADFLVLTDGEHDVASAMIYHVTQNIAQVIYWGNTPDGPCRNPMNLLAAEVCSLYAGSGFRLLDLGPSSEGGVPDFGLADFKESVGALCTPRLTFRF